MPGSMFLVCRYQTSFLYSYAVAYIFPKVVLPDTLRYLVKGEEGVVIVYMVKWQCSFKDSWSRYCFVNIIASWNCPGSNGRLL